MKYPEIVAAAKRSAVNSGVAFIVYRDLRHRWWNRIPKYNYCSRPTFENVDDFAIQLLMFLSNGHMVQ